MKCTEKFLKYTVLTILGIIMLISFTMAIVCALTGILNAILECNAQYLLLIPVALFSAFMGFVVVDCANALLDKWKLGKTN